MPKLMVIAGFNGSRKSNSTKLLTTDNSITAGHQLIATVTSHQTVIYVLELPSWIDLANLNLSAISN
jgi:hypothetical protein